MPKPKNAALEALLAQATAKASEPQTFRFHGRKSPANRERTEILARTPSFKVKDGVATLRLYEPIDSWGGPWGVSAVEFLDVLDELTADGETLNEIRLHINSPGGEVWEALAILNSMRDTGANIVAIVDGIAASAASFIAAAADETIMAPNSQMMIHDALALCVGNAEDMHGMGALLDKVSDNIASIYAAKAGTALSEWRDAMKQESWYNAQEAVDAGLADMVAGDDDTEEEPPADAFDVKHGIGAKYSDRSEAPAPVPAAPKSKTDPAPVPTDLEDRRARFQQRRHAANVRRANQTA